MAFLSPQADLGRLLTSPQFGLQSPLALFASPRPALKEGRLSFDVLLAEHDGQQTAQGVLEGMGAPRDAQIKGARSASQIQMFALAGAPERPKSAASGDVPSAVEQQQLQQLAALTEKVVAAAVAAKQQEVAQLVAGVASKYGLAADYGKAEETIKAVWAEQGPVSRANSAANTAPSAPKQQQQQQQQQQPQATGAGSEELTLGGQQGKGSSDNVSCGEEEAGQQATSTLKAQGVRADASEPANALKRPMAAAPGFSFRAPADEPGMGAAPGQGARAKKRRVQYDRMQELEAKVQRVRHLGDALKQSLRQAEAQHTAATQENEQLWNALLHIHASLRAAHAAHLRQQVAMHAAAMAAALPLPQPMDNPAAPSPNTLFGGLFSPDADELAAACGMFVSPAKAAHASGATNKPRKLFLEDTEGKAARPSLNTDGQLGDLPGGLSPSMWIQAA